MGTRGFYSSLLQENPNSKIAIKYAIEFGLLALDEHNKLLKKYNKMKENGDFNVAAKAKKMLEMNLKTKAAKPGKNKENENKENEKNSEKKEKKDKEGKEGKEKKEGKEGKEKKDKKDKDKKQ